MVDGAASALSGMSADAMTTPAPRSASSADLPFRLVIERPGSDVNVMLDRFLSWGASMPPQQSYHTYDVYSKRRMTFAFAQRRASFRAGSGARPEASSSSQSASG